MQNSATDVALGKHLEALANAAKQYTLAELLMLSQAVSADIQNLPTFEGASATAFGTSGLVPAPSSNDNDKFLRGDGSWGELIIGSVSSTINGALWLEIDADDEEVDDDDTAVEEEP